MGEKKPRFSHFIEEAPFSDTNNNSDYEVAQCEEMLSSLPSCSKSWNNRETVTDTEDDELFLIIDHHNDNDSGVFVSKEEQKIYHEMADDEWNCYRRTPRRKLRCDRDRSQDLLRDHPINYINSQDHFARASCKFEIVNKDLRSKIANIKEIINQEQSFLTKINHRRSSIDDRLITKRLTDNYDTNDNNTECFANNINEFCDNNETVIV